MLINVKAIHVVWIVCLMTMVSRNESTSAVSKTKCWSLLE